MSQAVDNEITRATTDLDLPLPEGLDAPGAAGLEGEAAAQSAGLAARALEWLAVGGPVVAVLLAMSVLALTLVFMKLLQFRALRLGRRQPAREALCAWKAGDHSRGLQLASGSRHPAAQALARAMRGLELGLPERQIREEVLRYGGDLLFGLRRGLRPLEVIGSLAPLLGLLGTVLGMIKAFQQLEAAGNQVNPAVLSGGIWEALMTTAVGLCVAIPVVALLNWLERRVDHLAHDMDNLVTQVFTPDLSEQAAPADDATQPKNAAQTPSSQDLETDQAHAKSRKLQPA